MLWRNASRAFVLLTKEVWSHPIEHHLVKLKTSVDFLTSYRNTKATTRLVKKCISVQIWTNENCISSIKITSRICRRNASALLCSARCYRHIMLDFIYQKLIPANNATHYQFNWRKRPVLKRLLAKKLWINTMEELCKQGQNWRMLHCCLRQTILCSHLHLICKKYILCLICKLQ